MEVKSEEKHVIAEIEALPEGSKCGFLEYHSRSYTISDKSKWQVEEIY